jgi:hypothetical protein
MRKFMNQVVNGLQKQEEGMARAFLPRTFAPPDFELGPNPGSGLASFIFFFSHSRSHQSGFHLPHPWSSMSFGVLEIGMDGRMASGAESKPPTGASVHAS